jgi:hypothetical protein
MPNKKKTRKRKSRKGSSRDLVAIQISAELRKVPKGFKITRKLLSEAIRRKAETSTGEWDGFRVVGASEGIEPSGIRLLIVRWKNPGRNSRSLRSWRYASDDPREQADAWGSLRRIISGARLSIRINGSGK